MIGLILFCFGLVPVVVLALAYLSLFYFGA
jgi:hypothetical protein